MMKSSFLKSFITSLLGLYPYEKNRKVDRYFNILFTHWVKKSFKHFGSNSIIERKTDIHNASDINIGDNVYIRKYGNLSAWKEYLGQRFNPTIIIGNNCSIGAFANISAVNRIVLKENVLVGRWVTIIDHAHGDFNDVDIQISPIDRPLFSKGEIVIEENVWISDKVTICSNVHIGKGAIIAANSVVTKNVTPYTMVGGCPARVIKTLEIL